MTTPEHGIRQLLSLFICVAAALAAPSILAVPRLVVTVPQIALSPNDTVGVLTINVSNYRDSLAGVELQLLTSDSSTITFLPTVDTVGTLMSKWETVGLSPIVGRIHLFGLANWTKFTVPPAPPSSGRPLIRLHFKVNRQNTSLDANLAVTVDTALSVFGFADPMGTLIGVERKTVWDTLCFRCTDGTPEACNNWEQVTEPPCDSIFLQSRSVVWLDTSQVYVGNGGVYLPGCCQGMRGNINSDPQNVVDLADLSMLISHLVVKPVTFPCLFEADLNGSGLVDLSDLSILVMYLLQGQALPSCPQ